MRFNSTKRQALIDYILEKIDSGDGNLAESVIDTFKINQSTLYAYLNELQKSGAICKVKRGKYELASKKYTYTLTRVNGELESDTYAYMTCLHDYVKDFPKNVEQIWGYAFSEMTNNIMDHSGAEHVKIIVEQSLSTTCAWLIDDGVGIFSKIKNHFNLDSLDDAVCELFKGKLTTDEKRHSGEGIFFSSRMMDYFCIISDGKIFTHNKYENDFINSLSLPYDHGTAVMMKLSNNSNRSAKEIFSKYEDEKGAFDKTEILMKNLFDTSPVSRSQAKRVCKGIEKFSKVELNFEGVEWMAQGFAHEIFKVYSNEHPEIQIIPTNMNEDIQRMYEHVLNS